MEGFFARLFRSGVHPVEIGKRLLRVMEDGRTVGLRRVYAPNVYRITLSQKDYERLSPLEAKLVEELEVFIGEAAKQRGWVLPDTPRVSFASGPRLSPGEFRIEAEAVAVAAQARATASVSGARSDQRTQAIASTDAVLVVLSDERPVQTVGITNKVRIGRQGDNDLVLPDPGASRHHAEVAEEADAYFLRDLGSTNGTSVNGNRIREHRLRDGERFVVGHTVIEFRRT